jgi:hypothetical protein
MRYARQTTAVETKKEADEMMKTIEYERRFTVSVSTSLTDLD